VHGSEIGSEDVLCLSWDRNQDYPNTIKVPEELVVDIQNRYAYPHLSVVNPFSQTRLRKPSHGGRPITLHLE
jgi:hypothetical protein